MTCRGVHAISVYLRLSSIPNILSVASPSGKQEELVESLRVTGLPERTAQQDRQAMSAVLNITLTCCSSDVQIKEQALLMTSNIDRSKIDSQATYSSHTQVLRLQPGGNGKSAARNRLNNQEWSKMPCWTHTSCR